jgi:hypothetical protein
MLKNILLVLALALVAFLVYIIMPTIAYGFYGVPYLVLFFGLVLLIPSFVNEMMDFSKIRVKIATGLVGFGFVFGILLPIITSWSAFHANSYRNIIGEVKTSNFTNDIAPIDLSKIRVVDKKLAAKLADKKLGDVPALGSMYKLGEFSIQKVKSDLYWVAPLEYSGLFKWLDSKGTPGYLIVSATNERDVRLIQKVNGKDIALKYLDSAWFSENLYRYVYFNGYMTKGFTDFSFEIDDDMNPYYVVTLYEKKVGYEGENAVGVIVVDPQTGKMKEYSIKDAPKWIDRIQPEDFVIDQLNDYGKYVDGWLNAHFAQEGVLKVTPGMSLVYGDDGQSYWYTGISSAGKDNSTVGFVLVNTRTKEAHYYKQSGATEVKAMASAEGMVQNMGYKATFPILYNLAGVPTYVMTLKDNEGLVKMIAMVSVENYSIVGVGKDLKTTLRNYKASLKSKGNVVVMESNVDLKNLTSIVTRLGVDIKDGNSYYYLQLQGVRNKIFVTNSSLSDTLPITIVGDRVKISYEDDTDNGVVDLLSFKNLEISLEKTQKQINLEKKVKKVELRKKSTNLNKKWENLSDSEKQALLKKGE